MFSWPSRGKTYDYVYDLNSAIASRHALYETGNLPATNVPALEDCSVVAHSMGTLLTVEAMRSAVLEGRLNRSGQIRSIILASPDIDVDLFKE